MGSTAACGRASSPSGKRRSPIWRFVSHSRRDRIAALRRSQPQEQSLVRLNAELLPRGQGGDRTLAAKEATARIKINRLLEEAGWRFFADEAGPANIVLEPNTKITRADVDALGEEIGRAHV